MNEPVQNQSPSLEEMEICAYRIWEDEGRPEGSDKTHWAKAEMRLPVSYSKINRVQQGLSGQVHI